MRHALVLVLAFAVAMPAGAQSADAPIAVLGQPLCPDCPCKSGDVVLSPEAAVDAAKRLVAAEAKVEVYDKAFVMPWWGVVIIGVVAAGAAVGVTAAIYEAGKAKPAGAP